MSGKKQLGIWMDHANAHLIEITKDTAVTETIESQFTHEAKEESLSRSENIMHNKEQHQQAEYYNKLGAIIRNYEEVLLFGPTNAKTELLNTLKADHLFENIKIEVKQAGKMTDNQQHAFVKEHFSRQ